MTSDPASVEVQVRSLGLVTLTDMSSRMGAVHSSGRV